MSDDRPLGLFDSGVGGLTVVKELQEVLPGESLVYFGDTARCPYGPRPADELRQIALSNLDFLVACGIKALVVACNTSTSVAIDLLEERSPVPVIGVIDPGAREAVRRTRGLIGVIATEATIKSGAYQKAIRSIDSGVEVIGQICAPFVPMIESEEYLKDPEGAYEIVRRCLEPLKKAGIDTLVLGCTHYPVLLPMIRRVLPGVPVVDPSREMALRTREILEEKGLMGSAREPEKVYYTSGDPEVFARIGGRILQRPIGKVFRRGGVEP